MTVSVEVLRQVEDELINEGLGTVGVKSLIVMRVLAAEPDAELARAIRNAYYNDGKDYPLSDSKDPVQWLRMAAAARKFLQSETGADLGAPLAAGPRVFHQGDVIPGDVYTVRLGGDAGGGRYDRAVRARDGRWLYADEECADMFRTEHTGWRTFNPDDFPLIEVLPDRKPRVWQSIGEVPNDVLVIRDRDGDEFDKRPEDAWTGELEGCFAPYTEVLNAF